MYLQQSFIYDITKSNISVAGHLGHTYAYWTVAEIMDIDTLNYIKNNYYTWAMVSMSISAKIIDNRNMFIFCDNGSSLANFYQGEGNPTTNSVKIFIGFFNQNDQFSVCNSTDVDVSASTFASIMEANVYKPLLWNGKPASTLWMNSNAYKDVHTLTTGAIGTSMLNTVFAGTFPTHDNPFGFDIMIPDRDRIQQNTGLGEWKIRVQFVINTCVQVQSKKPLDF